MSFDNVTKDLNKKRPFHRINSPVFNLDRDVNHLRELDLHLAGQENFLDGRLAKLKAALDGPLRPGDRDLVFKEFTDLARQRAETTRRRTLAAKQLADTLAVLKRPPTPGTFLVADGRGYDCGCRAAPDFPVQSFLSPKLLSPAFGIFRAIWDQIIERVGRAVVHTVPGWVTIARRGVDRLGSPVPVDLQPEKEMEGDLIRSFQTWTDNPLTQFHIWYDWNFYVEPIPGYQFIKGFGNAAPHIPAENFKSGVHTVSTDLSVEGEWDFGAVTTDPKADFPLHGPIFNHPTLWWPQAGSYVWLAGRWIYDCGHSDPPDDKVLGLMRSELHPVKAMATARWEAVKFDENKGVAVPAIQFMFVMSKHGGYVEWGQKFGDPILDLPPINATDYEFIVDLPKIDGPPIGWSIGHTPDNPLNVGALRRPHLLKKFDFASFNSFRGPRNEVTPIIEPIPNPKDPELPPEQVKVKIPCTALPPSTSSYGVIISLGWFDPNRVQAARVKEVTVTFQEVRAGTVQHDTLAGPFKVFEFLEKSEWQLRLCVNSRWIEVPVTKVSPKQVLTDGIKGQTFTFFLDEDEAVLVSTHGVEIDDVGDLMKDKSLADRTLVVNGAVARYQEEIVIPQKDVRNPTPAEKQQIHDTCRALLDQMMTTFNIQNEPLGIIDPGKGIGADLKINPFPVKDKVITEQAFTLTAHRALEVGELCELIVDPGEVDYTVHYTVTIKPQKLD